MKFAIKSRWTSLVKVEAEIDCAEDTPKSVKIGLAVKCAINSGADLSDADLRGANLPVIKNIHQEIYAAASQPSALDMGNWHVCDTTHCRGGWAVFLAGSAGRDLEEKMGTAAAAALIYMASDPHLDQVPNFYSTNADALADMARLAKAEKARA